MPYILISTFVDRNGDRRGISPVFLLDNAEKRGKIPAIINNADIMSTYVIYREVIAIFGGVLYSSYTYIIITYCSAFLVGVALVSPIPVFSNIKPKEHDTKQ